MIQLIIHADDVTQLHQHLHELLDGSSDEHWASRDKLAAAREPEFKAFGVNVYKSRQFPFTLGKKTYNDAADAERHQTRNGNWLNSFTLEVDLETGDVRPIDFGLPSVTMNRFFAVFKEFDGGIRLGENGYHTIDDVESAYLHALTYIRVSADGGHVHVERA